MKDSRRGLPGEITLVNSMNEMSPREKSVISDIEIAERVKRLGEGTVFGNWEVQFLSSSSDDGNLGPAHPKGPPLGRKLRNIWLTRNEGERRFGQLLLLAGYFHAVVSFFLSFGLLSRFPSGGVPVWLRMQAVVGFGLGIFLVAGGISSLFVARNAIRAARTVLAIYLTLLFAEGMWIYHKALHPLGVLYPWAAALLVFSTLGTVCDVRPQSRHRQWRKAVS